MLGIVGALFTLASAYAVGRLCLRAFPCPGVVRLAVGAATLSTLVFLLLVIGLAHWFVLTGIGVAAIALGFRPRFRFERWMLLFLPYALLYLTQALAPEIQPDALNYHVPLVNEYNRLGAFPDRIGFYEMLPQGFEMLMLFALSLGKESAARLLHLSFLAATVLLLREIGRALRLPDWAWLTAAALYAFAPVTGVTATSAYNDAALVFFVLAAFYLAIEGHFAAAGWCAGFCYAIKMPGGMVVAMVLLLAAAARRFRGVALAALMAAIAMAPWLVRTAVLTGNPLAPLANAWFPNPYFHATVEHELTRALRTYEGFSWTAAPYDLAIRGRLQGILGPLFLLLPAGLLSLRHRAGRLIWLAAAVLIIPWIGNVGTRFLMPAWPFLALAIAMSLPMRVAPLVFAAQVMLCWPNAVEFYAPRTAWILHGAPVRAALGIESQPDYLLRQIRDEYITADMVRRQTHPGEKVFSLMGVAKAYADREVLEFWHSAQSDQLRDALSAASIYSDTPLYRVRGEWPAQPVRGLRFRVARGNPGEWNIHEVLAYAGGERIFNSPQWILRGWPRPSEEPLAFDGNLVTRWRTWEPVRAGMYVEVDYDRPQMLTAVELITQTPPDRDGLSIYGLGADGKWRLLTAGPLSVIRLHEDLRRSAARAVKQAGYDYILAEASDEGAGRLSKRLVADPEAWGLGWAGQAGIVYLFRVL